MDHDRAFEGRLRDQGAHPLAAIVVLTLATVIGIGLVPSEGSGTATQAVSPVAPDAEVPGSTSRPTAAVPSANSRPWIAFPRPQPLSGAVGLVGLPPKGANPSEPQVGELVDSYPVNGGGIPYLGLARLYADGRLIWNRYYQSPDDAHDWHSTGYIEQRLTPEGVDLVPTASVYKKDPLRLPEWLPLGAWEDRARKPYVPSGYGICLNVMDPRPGNQSQGGKSIEPLQLVEMLPASVSSLLRDGESLWDPDYGTTCVAQTTEEARVLDGALRDAGFDQEEYINRYFLLQYSFDGRGAWGVEISLVFEPRFPDGSISCSACG